ncbi:MAG: hypothetical protein EB037_12725 [Actinobacteria bacterium]|nr:hypothetical protein [Actinomycetota bacterium]
MRVMKRQLGSFTLGARLSVLAASVFVIGACAPDAPDAAGGSKIIDDDVAITTTIATVPPNGESITGGDGTDVIRLTGDNSLNGVALSSIEGIQFDATGSLVLSAIASVFNGATFTVAERDNATGTTDDVNEITPFCNGKDKQLFCFSPSSKPLKEDGGLNKNLRQGNLAANCELFIDSHIRSHLNTPQPA